MKGEVPAVFLKLKPYIKEILKDEKLTTANVNIICRTLTAEEALGNPERDDFPLQKGREKLMQAEINKAAGQAFTDSPGNGSGTLEEMLNLPPSNNYNRAAIIATLNALMRSMGEITSTIHCKDGGPRECSVELAEYISCNYGDPRIALIGLQPAMAEALSGKFKMRIFDLDPQNKGKKFNEAVVEAGDYSVEELEKWCDLFLVTGSTVVNGTIEHFLDRKKPVLYYGTTIAGPARILGLNHFCPRAT